MAQPEFYKQPPIEIARQQTRLKELESATSRRISAVGRARIVGGLSSQDSRRTNFQHL